MLFKVLYIIHVGFWRLLMIIILGLGVTFLAGLVLYYGQNSKYLCMYLTIRDVYDLLTARWNYLEEYLLSIVGIVLGVPVATVIFGV